MWVTDVKAGRPRTSDVVQVMIYMYLLPVARPDLQGTTVKGLVVYGNHQKEIQPEEVDPAFVQSLQRLIHRLAARASTWTATRSTAGPRPSTKWASLLLTTRRWLTSSLQIYAE